MPDGVNRLQLRAKNLALFLLLACGFLLAGCDGGGDDDGGGGGTTNSAPVLASPNGAAGNIVIAGSNPSFTGTVTTGQNLALSFQATDANAGDTLTTTITVTGGTLSAAQAGFAQSFPYAPAGAVSPHTISLTGTAANSGTIALTVDVADGAGGTDQVTLTITISVPANIAPVLGAPDGSAGNIRVAGSDPTYVGSIRLGDNLALSFQATDADGGDTLTTTITVSGGTLTAAQAGFAESFPYSPAGSASPHTISLSGTAAMKGKIEFTIMVDDGNSGSDQITLLVRLGGPFFDFNGDGFGDVTVAAHEDDDGGSLSGVAFIFFGSATPTASIDASVADVILIGRAAGDRFSRAAPAGDVNGDGYDDLIVGAHLDDDGGTSSGVAYIFFGSASPPATIDASAADVILVGGDAGDEFGESVSSAGDLNGDGYDDVIVGALHDDDGGSDSGAAFIFFGSATLGGIIDAAAADVILVGGDIGDQFGNSVSLAGDVNGDGYDEVIVGAHMDDDGGGNSGAAFIFFGSATPPGTIDASAADIRLVGGDVSDAFGWSVSSAGDFNGDGFGDVTVGAHEDDDGGSLSGVAFIFFGSASPPTTIDASAADVILVGRDAGDRFSRAYSAGDVNGDGYDDVIVGAHLDDDGGASSGVAYIFFGSATPPSTIDASAADVILVGGDAGDEFGEAVSSSGDFNGDGFDDVIVGASRDDDGGSNSGAAFIFFGSATPPSTIDASAADVILVGADVSDAFGWSVGGR